MSFLYFKVFTHRASGSRRGKGVYYDSVCQLSFVVATRQLRGFQPQIFEVIPYLPSSSRADCPQSSVLSVPAPWVWRAGERRATACGASGRAAVGEKGRVNFLYVNR